MKHLLLKLMICLAATGFLFNCTTEAETGLDLNALGSNADYLVFGTQAGRCLDTECVELFKIENGRVYEYADNLQVIDEPLNNNNFVALGDRAYDRVEGLPNLFPEALLQTDQEVLGAPGAADTGFYYIETGSGSQVKRWRIDPQVVADYAGLPEFIEAINIVLPLIGNDTL